MRLTRSKGQTRLKGVPISVAVADRGGGGVEDVEGVWFKPAPLSFFLSACQIEPAFRTLNLPPNSRVRPCV